MTYQEAKDTVTETAIFRGTMEYLPANRRWACPVHVNQEPYPRTVAESLVDGYKFKRGVVAAVKAFAADKPFRGDNRDRFEKMAALHMVLSHIYGIEPGLIAHESGLHGGSSGTSHFTPSTNEITMEGKLSVITYLHEFGHALGYGEQQTCRWSLNLFRRCFPRSFARLNASGHTLIQS